MLLFHWVFEEGSVEEDWYGDGQKKTVLDDDQKKAV